MIRLCGVVGGACLALACASCERGAAQSSAATPPQRVEQLRVEVLESYPHDRGAFTQGLVLDGGTLYESTGLVGQSSLREVEVKTGHVLRRVDVPAPYFAEGLSLVGPRLYQLTWQDGKVLVYEAKSFEASKPFDYSGEGWGLCHDGREFVMSDGTDRLTFRGSDTFRPVREAVVRLGATAVDHLNELECVGDDVYANVWMTDRIVRVEGKSGRVTATIDASGLLTPQERIGVDVLNGIAYDAADGTFLITGKLWPRLFRVRFVR
ncbi:MAG: glutaminyl-peptide cyclotransferase [Vicinamibacterales bacterium]